jgi:Zn-dependent protease
MPTGDQLIELLPTIFIGYMCFLFSLTFHEFAHAWVAKKKGDSTGEVMGRLTMNPFPHMDILGTVILPLSAYLGNAYAFGWAKPVPVNTRNLRKPKFDMMWVGLAGPLSNLLLAVIGSILCAASIVFSPDYSRDQLSLQQILFQFVNVNLMLCLFNFIPIHPLDGGHIVEPFLPPKAQRFMEDYQMHFNIALIVLFITGMFVYFGRFIQALAVDFVTGAEFVLRLMFELFR